MKKKDLLKLYNTLVNIKGNDFTVTFKYFIEKNKILLTDEFNALKEAQTPPTDYIEFDKERAKLASDLADKDKDGKPIIKDNNFLIKKNLDKFQKAIIKLREKHSDVITKYEKTIKDFEKLLDEEVKFAGREIKLNDIPQSIEQSDLEVFLIANLIRE